jgi:hypothetical protein
MRGGIGKGCAGAKVSSTEIWTDIVVRVGSGIGSFTLGRCERDRSIGDCAIALRGSRLK